MTPTGKYFLSAVSWFMLVTFLLCLPGSKIPSIGFLSAIYFDKWVHIGLFSILVFLWGSYFIRRRTVPARVIWKLALAGIAYGTLMEFVQLYFIANRSFEVWDIAADSLGCITGAVLVRKRV